ncbi:MAG: hypothetical protein DA405_10435 [Bacteroidetes bacterium]|nr:MAG: hypothetical protein DA405_10435 [Bacteroidota bacterium]
MKISTIKLIRILCFFLVIFEMQGQEEQNCIKLLPSQLERADIPPIDRYDLDFYFHGTNQSDENKDSLQFDLFYTLQRNWVAHQELGYFTLLPFVGSIGDYKIKLGEGEGTSQLSLFEAKVPLRFTILKGRPSSNDIYKRMRVTLDYIPNFRMHLDESLPLSPADQRVGFGYDWAFWDNNATNASEKEKSGAYSATIEPITRLDYLASLNFSFQVHHYSNGQAGFFFKDSSDNNRRNNYKDGDFSTNYFKFGLTYNRNYVGNGALFQASLFFRNDWGMNEGFVYSTEQNRAYGRARIESRIDYRPKVFYMRKPISYKQDGERYLLRRAYQSLWRFEATFIADNLDNFQANLANWDGEKYRTGIRAYYQLNPLNHRDIGYMAMVYYGRDYLNIRYDNIVYSFQLGISFSLDKFFPSTYHTNRTVIGRMANNYRGPYDSSKGNENLPLEYEGIGICKNKNSCTANFNRL